MESRWSESTYKLEYTGEVNPPAKEEEAVFQGKPVYPYLPSPELKESVKLAIALRRPLLLMGEPGCGKTKLATAIAYEFTQTYSELLNEENEKEWPLFTWYVKSTSKAKEGLYIYDAIARLRDAQLANSEFVSNRKQIIKYLEDKKHRQYIKFGPLGKALEDVWKVALRTSVEEKLLGY